MSHLCHNSCNISWVWYVSWGGEVTAFACVYRVVHINHIYCSTHASQPHSTNPPQVCNWYKDEACLSLFHSHFTVSGDGGGSPRLWTKLNVLNCCWEGGSTQKHCHTIQQRGRGSHGGWHHSRNDSAACWAQWLYSLHLGGETPTPHPSLWII